MQFELHRDSKHLRGSDFQRSLAPVMEARNETFGDALYIDGYVFQSSVSIVRVVDEAICMKI